MATNGNELVWTSKKEWGYDSRTHSADGAGWHFHTAKVSREWVLRGWGPDGKGAFRYLPTLAAAKQEAADILAGTNGKEGA